MYYLQAIHSVALLFATVAILAAVTWVAAETWRGAETGRQRAQADGYRLAMVLLDRDALRRNERGEEIDPSFRHARERLTAWQGYEPQPPTADRRSLSLRLAPVYFVGALLLQWVIGRLLDQNVSPWTLAGGAWIATGAGICVAHLLHRGGVDRARGEGMAYVFVALLTVLSALTQGG